MINNDILVNEALSLFHRRGIRATMEDLANNLHVSKRTLYEQIGSKSDLITFILEYFTKKINNYYDEIISLTNINNFEKFKMLLSAIPQKIYFGDDQLKELKMDYPSIYIDYCKRVDNRWERLFVVLEDYLKTVPQVKIDKNVFRLAYMSVIEGIYKCNSENEKINFQESVNEITELLLSGISTNTSETIGGMRLSDLLSTLSIGVCLVKCVDNQLHPMYLSPGFYNLYADKEMEKCFDPSVKICKEDREKFFIQYNRSIKDNSLVDSTYRIITNGKIKWHQTRAIKIPSADNVTFLAVVLDVTDSKQKEMELSISEERFKLAFEQTAIAIWEYDTPKKTISLSNAGKTLFNSISEYLYNVPTSLIESGFIHQDSTKTITQFFKNIDDGVKSGNCIIKIKDSSNIYWLKMSFKNIFDKDGSVVKAIGISEKVNNSVDVKSRFNHEEALNKLLVNELILSIEINISKNEIIRVNNSRQLSNLNVNIKNNYDDVYEELKNIMIYEEERQKYAQMFSKEEIINVFEHSKSSGHMSFRCCKNNGQIIWVSYTVNLIAEPISGDLYLFGYIRDIDTKMKLELSLSRKVEYDVTTRLYITSTTKKMTNLAISMANDLDSMCAFAIMEIANFAQIKRQFGLDVGEKLLFYIGRVLRICFNNKNIVGRIVDNQFAIFFPNVENPIELRSRIDDIIAMAHNSYVLSTNDEKITDIRTSVIINKVGDSNYDRLLYIASKKLEQIKKRSNSGKDIIDNIDEYNELLANKRTDSNHSSIFGYDLIDTSNVEITEILLDCTTTLLSHDTIKNSINYILNKINDYYDSFRSYIIDININNSTISCNYEYCESESELLTLCNTLSFNKIPALVKACKDNHTILINNIKEIKDISTSEKSILSDLNINSIYLIPLTTNGVLTGYVGVDNPKEHIGDISLLLALAYFITNEIARWRVQEKQKYMNEYDGLSQLRNHNSYRKRVMELRNSMLSSLGVACININDLRRLNSENGSDFGDSMILVVSQALKHQFRDLDLYRYESEKFAVLCQDINYHIFNEKIKRVCDEINGVRPGLITIGHTWADNDIDVERLIIHSEEIIAINRKDGVSEGKKEIIINEKLVNLIESIEKGWFEVFLQPKYDLSTNKVCGAEALIRMNHPLYGLISPVKMIPILERDRLVGYVDLFVLEQVCKTLSRWKKEKRKLLPIAINYSRMTLLENNIIERTTDILKKYDVSNVLIEIEITETIGNMEQKIISEMANKFVEAGIRLAIDDFGSKYSSLSTLSVIPFNVVKLDKSIVNDLVTNIRSQVIVEYVIMMCKKLGMKSVAEGIETEAQLKELVIRGCDYGQGYLFEKPIPINDFEEKYNEKK